MYLCSHSCKVPLLDANSETLWVFDVLAKKTQVSRLFTTMTGSVVTTGAKKPAGSRKRTTDAASANKENKQPRTGSAKSKAKAKAAALPSIPDDDNITCNTVTCSVGVRNKLWIDDLLKVCEHVSHQVTQLYGDATNSTMKRDLKTHLISQGLLFCFRNQVMLDGAKGPKQFKRWSQMRAALKDHGVQICLKEIIG